MDFKNNKIFKIMLFSSILVIITNILGDGVMAAESISESLNEAYISEENYSEKMKDIVEPYVKSAEEEGSFIGVDNLEIYYERYTVPDSKANIVISHGYSEFIEKYDELIYTYLKQGYNVFIMEHRGHGRSGNLGAVDKSQVAVINFDDYISDFKVFMDSVVIPNSEDKKILLFAHSMGGAIGTKFMEENSGYFDAAVLSSPMFKINSGSTPYFIVNAISNVATFFGLGERYVLGQGEYESIYDIDGCGTGSIERYDYNFKRIDSNEIIQRGGVSFKWLKESIKATKEVLKKDNIEKIDIPVLIFQATEDTYVKIESHNEFMKYAKNCTIEVVEGARHDIYTEKDEIRKAYLEKVFKFYEENL